MLNGLGLTHVVMEPEEVLDLIVTLEEDPVWLRDTACGVMCGKNIVLFDKGDLPVGMLYPEGYDGVERYAFDRSDFSTTRKTK